MSCDTLNAQPVRLNVSMGALPEGFCPKSMQELAEAIAARLIVTPNQNSSSFVNGSVAPTSNVGPWFKDCQEWWVFDDASGMYVPLVVKQFTRMEVFNDNFNWVNNFNASFVMAELWGGGGGGGKGGGNYGGGGGGGGAYARLIVPVAANTTYSGTVGAAGGPAGDGGDTTFSTGTAGGGKKGTDGSGGGAGQGGAGGTATAAGFETISGQKGTEGESNIGARGGDSPKGGGGGYGSAAAVAGGSGVGPGGGGGGGSDPNNGGSGGKGRVILLY